MFLVFDQEKYFYTPRYFSSSDRITLVIKFSLKILIKDASKLF